MAAGQLRADEFNNALIRPIPIVKKTGLDNSDVSSNRPVPNLSIFTKPLERQLTAYLHSHQLLPVFQSGLRSGHSTQTAVQRVVGPTGRRGPW